ncbi:hypothetical protein L3X38_010065 [Prunus dulcis]|uniref:Uncharacterized protein n=1 Tax=Prunus dulcis TaxID=3755 RepID=A0AAD4ZDN9_PRUDU|nr:hypothetical protein L3X38_010065 [Prunus dulcis]
MTHFAEELSSIKNDVATLVATIACMDESLSKVSFELASKNEEKDGTLRTSCLHQYEVKLNKEDNNMFDMGCDEGQLDSGNTKPPKSKQDKQDGSSNKDLIVTGATADRKPGLHKRTPYEDFNALKVKANAKT